MILKILFWIFISVVLFFAWAWLYTSTWERISDNEKKLEEFTEQMTKTKERIAEFVRLQKIQQDQIQILKSATITLRKHTGVEEIEKMNKLTEQIVKRV